MINDHFQEEMQEAQIWVLHIDSCWRYLWRPVSNQIYILRPSSVTRTQEE